MKDDYATAYHIAIRMMADPNEAGFKKEWHAIAQRCLLVSSNKQHLRISFPVSLSKNNTKETK